MTILSENWCRPSGVASRHGRASRCGLSALAAGGLLAGLLAATAPAVAAGNVDMLSDCERHAEAFLAQAGEPGVRVRVDRGDSLVIDRYDANVGSQRVSTEFFGRAAIDRAGKTTRQSFVCLHAGAGKGAVYVGFFPD